MPEVLDASLVILPSTDIDSVVVLTKGERDATVLEALSRSEARFVGFLASRSRLRKNLEELRSRGVPEAFLSRIASS